LADQVADAARRPTPPNAPIVGDAVFSHESGIHVSGLLRDAATYEALDPQLFGRERRITLGKHSGSAAVRDALISLDISPDSVSLPQLIDRLRRYAEQVKRPVERAELVLLLTPGMEQTV
jgi:homocitrate synthase NifV